MKLMPSPGDDYQDQKWDQRPDNFDSCVFVKVRSLVTLRLAMGKHRIEHHAEHADEDDDDQHHDVFVQVVDIVGYLGRRRLQVPFQRPGAAGCCEREETRHERPSSDLSSRGQLHAHPFDS
jgi:hypothetical protein